MILFLAAVGHECADSGQKDDFSGRRSDPQTSTA
jgi:hypothetical protein